MSETVVMFPGQGVQEAGMGRELFDEYPDLTAEADEILGYSVRRLCHDNPDGLLDDTLYTQPAVYVVNALEYRHWRGTAGEPDGALGHSLGEYNALEAAGALTFGTGLRLVQARAQLTGAVRGAMTVVLGLDEERIRHVLAANHHEDVEIVNFNTPTQLVLAGPPDSIGAAEVALDAAGAASVRRLAVSGPFHSSHMARAATEFAARFRHIGVEEPRFPVIANLTARPHRREEIMRSLAAHIDHPVRWADSIRWILERHPRATFEAMGKARILIRMLKRIRSELSLTAGSARG
ncbi:trans-AT polyketide synthase, acyltransferase and oxidoreductase domain-containing protein [Nonomuraea solani]|uniref:Malonyl CoA-acyl carrier protein transacylase n=1 Tax=Nonomuraea solani TaxID=1144553 RepID=A0A1H5Y840_9ACTN|nr:ACP S-malonyltransferase [Nonomuraea solani]SEG19827.1 trans-AT polyketide synthase, acyltransferase and oxidoreductase domain-containing protein [Nonomuraea solani]